MARKFFSIVYLLTGIVIGLGAFGHGSNVRLLVAEFAKFPAFDPLLLSVLYAVWYFVSGCMLVFGAIVVWTWWRWRQGQRGIFFPADAIGAFYVLSGVAMVIGTGKPFFSLFVVLGALLLMAAQVLRKPA
jgi:hypothetical protein